MLFYARVQKHGTEGKGITKGVKEGAAGVAVALALEAISDAKEGAIPLAAGLKVVRPPLALHKAGKGKLDEQQCGCTHTDAPCQMASLASLPQLQQCRSDKGTASYTGFGAWNAW